MRVLSGYFCKNEIMYTILISPTEERISLEPLISFQITITFSSKNYKLTLYRLLSYDLFQLKIPKL